MKRLRGLKLKQYIVDCARRLPSPIRVTLRTLYHRVAGKTAGSSTNPWNEEAPFSYSEMWLGANECIASIQRKISGDPNMHWLPYVLDKYLAPALGMTDSARCGRDYRCLVLGSNEGHMERLLCEKGFTGEIVASDIADKAILRARQKAAMLGYTNITYVIADLNKASFKGEFDYIIGEGVLHHIQNIERVLQMLSAILKPDGVLILVEFEGPVRFQLPEHQVRWINAALGIMPKDLRPFPRNGDEKEWRLPPTPKENEQIYYVPPTEASVIEFDPSEAIAGPELKRLIPKIFDISERKGFGGTLLSYMTGHFDFKRTNDDEYARSWLKILIQIEETVIQNKMLDDEFVFYVLRSKKKTRMSVS